MAHSKSAKKRVRQNITARARNRWRLRSMRVAIKEFQQQITAGNADQAAEAYKRCASVIDRSARRGVIHRNQAARRKSRLNARLKALRTGA